MKVWCGNTPVGLFFVDAASVGRPSDSGLCVFSFYSIRVALRGPICQRILSHIPLTGAVAACPLLFYLSFLH